MADSWKNVLGQMKIASIIILNYFSPPPPPGGPPPPPPTSPSRHTLLLFMVPVLLAYLQLKYQGNPKSPFETHPKSMLVSIGSLLLYSWGYEATLKWPIFASVVSRLMVVFGSLLLASLASILFPDSFGPVLYFSYFLFHVVELLKLLIWIYQKIMGIFSRQVATDQAVPNTGDGHN